MDSALMSLIQNKHRVGREVTIYQHLSQQHTVGHVFNTCFRAGHIFETNTVSHLLSKPAPKLFSYTLCYRHRSNTPGLRAPDLPIGCKSSLRQVLRHLRCLSTSRISNYDKYLMVSHSLNEPLFQIENGQALTLFQYGGVGFHTVTKARGSSKCIFFPIWYLLPRQADTAEFLCKMSLRTACNRILPCFRYITRDVLHEAVSLLFLNFTSLLC
mmetsp:Transcript_20217/g.51655  ORF Transcript_20217/g.51655 Transcript_20217/m.51655 type:complete len:213 (-) Transcript_20217:1412-2050(-)